jgi:hydroxymethylpyrimidine pyrophosphatase-like HAD family hydrolase
MSGHIATLGSSPLAADVLSRARIAYTDVDGTLLGRGGCLLCDLAGEPSLAAAKAVADVNAAGLPVVIVSGRTVEMLKEMSRLLGWRDFIAELGAVRAYDRASEIVYDLGGWHEEIPVDLLTGADDAPAPRGLTPYAVIERSGALEALFEAFPGKLEYHTPHHTGRQATHLLRGHVDNAEAQAVLDRFAPPMTWLDNGLIAPPATTLVGVDTVHAYHIMPAGTSKAGAILADLAHRGLDPGDAVMIGDSAADLAVHTSVSLVVLVGNALRSPAVASMAGDIPNVAVTEGAAGEGWAEFAAAWLAARGA